MLGFLEFVMIVGLLVLFGLEARDAWHRHRQVKPACAMLDYELDMLLSPEDPKNPGA